MGVIGTGMVISCRLLGLNFVFRAYAKAPPLVAALA
jgi:hypothetical protein